MNVLQNMVGSSRKKLDAFFGGGAADSDETETDTAEDSDEAIADAMGDAIAFSCRCVVYCLSDFVQFVQRELQNMIDEMNQL